MQPHSANFKEAFCKFYHYSPESFTRRAFFRAFYPHALLIALLLYPLKTRSIRQAINAIEQAARATTADEINHAINDYRYHLRLAEVSPWVRGWRIRLSGRRLLNLFARVTANETATEPNSFPVAPASRA